LTANLFDDLVDALPHGELEVIVQCSAHTLVASTGAFTLLNMPQRPSRVL